MSYDISFKVKVQDIDCYVEVGNCQANTTWNVREMICKATGLEWKNCENNGFCKDIIPFIEKGWCELHKYPEKYKQYEAENGWGTVESTKGFFEHIIKSWEEFCKDCEWLESTKPLKDVATFWIE